jgi:hypothetical protein
VTETRLRIQRNIENVRRRIAQAAQRRGRSPEAVRLVAVTKSVGVAEAQVLRDLGVADLGENRVEDARPKIETMGRTVCWHMIGSVQRRKAPDVAALFDCVDSVDRVELAEALDRRCEKHGRDLRLLIEVNVSGEAAKHGFTPANVEAALNHIRRLPRLTVEGLMTMAPLVDDPETVRPVFARLRRLAEQVGVQEISMGMSNDFEVAVEEGATQVRIGAALFA